MCCEKDANANGLWICLRSGLAFSNPHVQPLVPNPQFSRRYLWLLLATRQGWHPVENTHWLVQVGRTLPRIRRALLLVTFLGTVSLTMNVELLLLLMDTLSRLPFARSCCRVVGWLLALVVAVVAAVVRARKFPRGGRKTIIDPVLGGWHLMFHVGDCLRSFGTKLIGWDLSNSVISDVRSTSHEERPGQTKLYQI
jgi:hypothetical protein